MNLSNTSRALRLCLSLSILFASSLGTSLPAHALPKKKLCDTFLRRNAAAPVGGGERAKLRNELESLFASIENHYGPLKMKAGSVGLNWEQTKAQALAKLTTIKTIGEFYFLVSDLLASFNDAHVSVSLPSGYSYSLPLQFSQVGAGKIIVNFVDTEQYPAQGYQPVVGDELVSINGLPIAEFQKKYPIFNKNGNNLTNLALFARMLTHLSEARGLPFSDYPSSLELSFKDAKGKVNAVTLDYQKTGLGIIDRPVREIVGTTHSTTRAVDAEFDLLMKQPGFSELEETQREKIRKSLGFMHKFHELFDAGLKVGETKPKSKKAEGTFVDLGHEDPLFALPEDFEQIVPPKGLEFLLDSGTFFAGTFMRDGKRVGLLRISSYSPKSSYSMPYAVRYFIGELQRKSDVLLIDQMDNPGGAVILSDLLIQSLVGKLDESKHLKFAVKPSQGFLRQYAEMKAGLEEDMSDMFTPEEKKYFVEGFTREFEKVNQAFKNGDDLSKPFSLSIMSEFFEKMIDAQIKSNPQILMMLAKAKLETNILEPQVYTKDVFFLTNELDFSGGDATPASFQDYGRGKIVGVHTAGAGGTVEEFQQRAIAEYEYRLTTSLMVRKDGSYVENKGVTPDVDFAVTEEDYKDGFTTFLDRLLKQLGI